MDCRLFVDKYAPQKFDEIAFNQKIGMQLMACSQTENIPHLILKGGEGSGRKTFANLYIIAKYHLNGGLKVRSQTIEIKNGSKKIELQMLYSEYHHQIEPSLHGVYDRLIMQGFVKDILQVKPVINIPYHIIIVTNADQLTIEAQQSLRRTLEKNISTCRFIFIIKRETNLIDPLMSRCIQLRLTSPTNQEIFGLCQHVCVAEQIEFDPDNLMQLVLHSRRNLTKALDLLQATHLNHPSFLTSETSIDLTLIDDQYAFLVRLTQTIETAKTPQDIWEIRTQLYDLLVQCLNPTEILKNLFYQIFTSLDAQPPLKLVDPCKNVSKIKLQSTSTSKNHSQPDIHILTSQQKQHQLIELLSNCEHSLRKNMEANPFITKNSGVLVWLICSMATKKLSFDKKKVRSSLSSLSKEVLSGQRK